MYEYCSKIAKDSGSNPTRVLNACGFSHKAPGESIEYTVLNRSLWSSGFEHQIEAVVFKSSGSGFESRHDTCFFKARCLFYNNCFSAPRRVVPARVENCSFKDEIPGLQCLLN